MYRIVVSALIVSISCLFRLKGADLTGVDPDLLLAANALNQGGTEVTVRGSDLAAAQIVRIGGKNLLGQTFDARARTFRGHILVSKSQRASCLLDFDAPPPGATFRRGDADSIQVVDISDPILTLEFLFLGRGFLSCEDAADSDDSGALDITDAIYSLEYQFLGKSAPPSPGPFTCGRDPTNDPLKACGSRCN